MSSSTSLTPRFVLRGHRSPIHTLAFARPTTTASTSAASNRLTSSASSALVQSGTQALVATAATSSSSSPTSALPLSLISGDATGTVIIWNLTTRRAEVRLTAHTQPVLGVHALEDGRVVTQGKDGVVKIWNLSKSSESPEQSIMTDSYTFFKMQVSELTPNAPLLLLPCEEASNLALFDPHISTTEPMQLIECEQRIERDYELESRFGDRLDEKELKEMNDLLASQPTQYERKVGMCMAARFFQPPENSDTSSSASSSSSTSSSSSSSASASHDRLMVCWASESGFMGVWSIRTKSHLFKQQVHKDTILSFDLSADGRFGVSCSSGSDLIAWSIDIVACKFNEIGRVSVPHDGLAEVVLREDGRLFATAGWDHRVRLFDASILAPLAVLHEHSETVQCVAMPISLGHAFPSGYLASGAKDGKIAVYQVYPNEQKDSEPQNAVEKHQSLHAQRHSTTTASQPQLTSSSS